MLVSEHRVLSPGLAGKESDSNARELGSISGLGGSPGEGKGYPLQYSSLENSMDCVIHWVTQSQTRLSDHSGAGNARDVGLIPGLGRSSGEGKGYPLQYSSLENSMGCLVHGVAKSRT